MAQTEKKTSPLYAVVGAGDLVVEKVRHRRPALDPIVLWTVPEKLQCRAAQTVDQAGDVYADLVQRGTRLVTRVRNQKSTEDLQRQASTTRSQAKGAATAVKNTARTTRTRAKATTTSAKKTASQAAQAATDAAEKVGD